MRVEMRVSVRVRVWVGVKKYVCVSVGIEIGDKCEGDEGERTLWVGADMETTAALLALSAA